MPDARGPRRQSPTRRAAASTPRSLGSDGPGRPAPVDEECCSATRVALQPENKMAPPPSARRPAANRGGLSDRQWADIRRAARTARSEKVVLVVHNVKIFADNQGAAGNQQRPGQISDRHDGGRDEPTETGGDARTAAQRERREERDALRRAHHVPRRCVERWARLVGPMAWAARRQLVDATFVTWRRSRMSPQRDAQRKMQRLGRRAWLRHCRLLWRLRCFLWRSWTHRDRTPDPPVAGLGLCSRRDAYIYYKASGFVPQLIDCGLLSSSMMDTVNEEEDAELQEAIRLSLANTDARNPGVSDPDARSPSGRTACTRSLTDAGIPATPGSARARKKRSGKRS